MITAYGTPEASAVLIQMVDEHDLEGLESETAEIRKLTGEDFYLMAVKVGTTFTMMTMTTMTAMKRTKTG